MQQSRRSEYALLALIDLATDDRRRVQLHEVAARQAIPVKYLEQLARPLKSAGLIMATRGSRGGYQLARPPEQITALEVVEAVEGPLEQPEEAPSHQPGPRVVRALWAGAREQLRAHLAQITLAQMVADYQSSRQAGGDWVI